jgi:hypothetical protein
LPKIAPSRKRGKNRMMKSPRAGIKIWVKEARKGKPLGIKG